MATVCSCLKNVTISINLIYWKYLTIPWKIINDLIWFYLSFYLTYGTVQMVLHRNINIFLNLNECFNLYIISVSHFVPVEYSGLLFNILCNRKKLQQVGHLFFSSFWKSCYHSSFLKERSDLKTSFSRSQDPLLKDLRFVVSGSLLPYFDLTDKTRIQAFL